MWIDSHCHVTADRFAADRAAVLERALAAGVETLVAIGSGYGIDGNEGAAALAREHAAIYATAGCHPHEAAELDDAGRSKIRALAQHFLGAFPFSIQAYDLRRLIGEKFVQSTLGVAFDSLAARVALVERISLAVVMRRIRRS